MKSLIYKYKAPRGYCRVYIETIVIIISCQESFVPKGGHNELDYLLYQVIALTSLKMG